MSEKQELMVVNDQGFLVKRELGLDEGAKDYASYNELVDDLRDQATTINRQILEVNWNIGRQAWILKNKSSYGNHDIAEFAKDLDLGPSSIYTAIKFYESNTLSDVRRMRDEDIAYRKAVMLLKAEDEKARSDIEELLTDFRIDEGTLKRIVDKTNDGVRIPEEQSERREFVDACRNLDTYKELGKDDDADDDEEEENEDTVDAADPVAKFRANLQTDLDNLSLALSDVVAKSKGIINVLKGELYASLDNETKESLRGILSGMREELQKTSKETFQLVKILPQPETKDADAVPVQ